MRSSHFSKQEIAEYLNPELPRIPSRENARFSKHYSLFPAGHLAFLV